MIEVLSDVSLHKNISSTKYILQLFPNLLTYKEAINQICVQLTKLGYAEILSIFINEGFDIYQVLEYDSIGIYANRASFPLDLLSIAC